MYLYPFYKVYRVLYKKEFLFLVDMKDICKFKSFINMGICYLSHNSRIHLIEKKRLLKVHNEGRTP